MYLGAWEAFESKNPDRYSHVSVSMRKLIEKLLGRNATEIKEKIHKISGSHTSTEFILSLAKTVISLRKALHKGVHEEIDRETALLTTRITEAIIEYLYEKEQL